MFLTGVVINFTINFKGWTYGTLYSVYFYRLHDRKEGLEPT